MTPTTDHHSPSRAISWGALCGVRSMLAPAILSRRLEGASSLSRIQHTLTSPSARLVLQGLALAELVADKTPIIPARVASPALFGRALNGALMGLASAPPMSPIERAASTPFKESQSLRLLTLAALGAGAAVSMAVASYYARKAASEQLGLPSAAAGLLEDGLVALVAAKLP